MDASSQPEDLCEAVLREGPTACTVRIDGPRGVVAYEKRYAVLWPWWPLGWLLKGSLPALSARAEADNARALRALGIAAPEATVHGERWRIRGWPPGLLREGTCRLAPLAGRRLDEVLGELDASARGTAGAAARVTRRALGAALGDLVRTMHAAGRFHRDLYLCHVLVGEPGGALALLDVARAGRARWLARRRAVKDLAALAYASRGLVTRGDQLAFLARYLGPRDSRAARRTWARRALAKARRIARHGRKG